MANRNDLAAYTSSLLNLNEHADLQERLRLYQVFLKLYEHHRSLLDEILDLENTTGSPLRMTLPYVQGFVSGAQSYLVTNLMQGKTQALMQPQQSWIIGRDPRRSFISIQDIRLSRRHAAIKYVPEQGFYLIDLGSRNQSFVNGEPVRQALLKDGDQIRLGSVTFAFFLCQSTKTLDSLSPELLAHLSRSESFSAMPASLDAEINDSFSDTEMEEDSLPTLDLYTDTSGFLRSTDGDHPLF